MVPNRIVYAAMRRYRVCVACYSHAGDGRHDEDDDDYCTARPCPCRAKAVEKVFAGLIFSASWKPHAFRRARMQLIFRARLPL